MPAADGWVRAVSGVRPGRAGRAAWYVNRLRSMPPAEVPHRVAEQGRRWTGRLPAPRRAAPRGRRVETGLADLVLAWRDEPQVREFWREQAERVAEGRVDVFGEPWPTSRSGVPDWDVDPPSGRRWPDAYCFDVPLVPGGEPVPEVRRVWELNRLTYLLPVAACAAEDRNASAARLCTEHIRSWVERHPPRRGVLWRSGIELAFRVVSLLAVLELLSRHADRQPDLEALVARSVSAHVDWVRRFPSRFSSANNHRITELAALVVAAAAYPELAGSAEIDAWWGELDVTARAQFHADGVPAEQATEYGVLDLEWLAVCLHVAGRQGRALSPETGRRLRSAAGFLAAVTDGAGQLVRFGDDDGSRLLVAARPPGPQNASVLGLLTAVVGGVVPRGRPGLATFAAGGYAVARAGAGPDEVLWVLDHGPLGMGRLAAHAHADALAVYLHCGGRPVFLDAGTYLYHSAGHWRDRLRGTAAHNTVAVGGVSSSLPSGPFNWRPGRAEARLVSAASTPPGWTVEAEHTGYLERFGVVHHRSLATEDGRRFRLTDWLEGHAEALPFRWSLLVAPDLEVAATPEGWCLRESGTDLVRVDLPAEWRASARTHADWFSPAFGRLVPAGRLLVEGELGAGRRMEVGITVLGRRADAGEGSEGR